METYVCGFVGKVGLWNQLEELLSVIGCVVVGTEMILFSQAHLGTLLQRALGGVP
jgi:hypothetical protein